MSVEGARPFPCPFCGSENVLLVGGGLVFLHYQCSDCAEVWTAMAAATPAFVRARRTPENLAEAPVTPSQKQKVWRH